MPDKLSYYEVIRECLSESTAHGIPYVFRRDQISIKLAWLLCTFLSAGVCGYIVSKSISDYFSYETVTKAQTIFETPAIFPTISICSQNMFASKAGAEYVRNYSIDNELGDLETDWLYYTFFMDSDFLKYGLGVNLLGRSFSDEMRRDMGLKLDDMILLCYFNNFGCDHTDFDWYFDPYYG